MLDDFKKELESYNSYEGFGAVVYLFLIIIIIVIATIIAIVC